MKRLFDILQFVFGIILLVGACLTGAASNFNELGYAVIFLIVGSFGVLLRPMIFDTFKI